MSGNKIRLMAPVSRPLVFVRAATVSGGVLACVLFGMQARQWHEMGIPERQQQAPCIVPAFATEPRGAANSEAWLAMSDTASDAPTNTSAGAGSGRFRLAGTFGAEGDDGQVRRKAILDDPRHEQHLVGEGDRVGDTVVEQIFYDHVRLRTGDRSEEIWLDFGRALAGTPAAITNALATTAAGSGATNRFGGVQLQADRWQFSRQGLLSYYQELLEEPDRMVAIFDSLKPLRDSNAKITGYVVGIEGEADFFKAVGLQEGDVVRKVNSVPMTSRRRAEFFIDEFLKDRMNVVSLEIERANQPGKFIYQIRP